MTRYEKFMESINTPEKLIEVLEEYDVSCFEKLLGKGFCKSNCKNDLQDCIKCELNYLKQEINE